MNTLHSALHLEGHDMKQITTRHSIDRLQAPLEPTKILAFQLECTATFQRLQPASYSFVLVPRNSGRQNQQNVCQCQFFLLASSELLSMNSCGTTPGSSGSSERSFQSEPNCRCCLKLMCARLSAVSSYLKMFIADKHWHSIGDACEVGQNLLQWPHPNKQNTKQSCQRMDVHRRC